jgi:hypothetical protein
MQHKDRQAEAERELEDRLDAYLMLASYDEEPVISPATSNLVAKEWCRQRNAWERQQRELARLDKAA